MLKLRMQWNSTRRGRAPPGGRSLTVGQQSGGDGWSAVQDQKLKLIMQRLISGAVPAVDWSKVAVEMREQFGDGAGLVRTAEDCELRWTGQNRRGSKRKAQPAGSDSRARDRLRLRKAETKTAAAAAKEPEEEEVEEDDDEEDDDDDEDEDDEAMRRIQLEAAAAIAGTQRARAKMARAKVGELRAAADSTQQRLDAAEATAAWEQSKLGVERFFGGSGERSWTAAVSDMQTQAGRSRAIGSQSFTSDEAETPERLAANLVATAGKNGRGLAASIRCQGAKVAASIRRKATLADPTRAPTGNALRLQAAQLANCEDVDVLKLRLQWDARKRT